MARNHNGQMALYEVLNKEKFSASQKKELARIEQAKAEKLKPVTITPQSAAGGKNTEADKSVWKKPGLFGFNGGKIETYVPYPIAITIAMGIVLILIIVFQAGHFFGKHDAVKNESSSEAVLSLADTAKAAKEMARLAAPTKRSRTSSDGITFAATTTTVSGRDSQAAKDENKAGQYVIVLKELGSQRDLEPAMQYFNDHGIATEIRNFRGSYFLVTRDKYEGFSKGSAGYDAIEKIKQVGAKYKEPQGYSGFAPHMFNDVYGRKM
jgi:hypothetical protein